MNNVNNNIKNKQKRIWYNPNKNLWFVRTWGGKRLGVGTLGALLRKSPREVAKGRKEAKKRGIAPLYDEWIETERAYFARCQEGHAFDDEVLALQRIRLSLAEKVKLRSMGIGE